MPPRAARAVHRDCAAVKDAATRGREARTFADAGNFTEASHALYGAVVEALTVAGVVRYHRSKTAGDYARELRRAGSPIAADFRSFGRSFDRLAFGQSPVSRDDYDATGNARRADCRSGHASRGRVTADVEPGRPPVSSRKILGVLGALAVLAAVLTPEARQRGRRSQQLFDWTDRREHRVRARAANGLARAAT